MQANPCPQRLANSTSIASFAASKLYNLSASQDLAGMIMQRVD
jgi:hypothetical protein